MKAWLVRLRLLQTVAAVDSALPSTFSSVVSSCCSRAAKGYRCELLIGSLDHGDATFIHKTGKELVFAAMRLFIL